VSKRVNWGWIRDRVTGVGVGHVWDTGDGEGRKACVRCGVWRWYPIGEKR